MVWLCFIVHVTTGDIYKDIGEDIEAKFDTSNYKLNRPLPKGKKKKVMDVMKCKLGGKIMKEFVKLGAKTYTYLIDDASEDKKSQRGKKVCRKKKSLRIINTVWKQLNLKTK